MQFYSHRIRGQTSTIRKASIDLIYIENDPSSANAINPIVIKDTPK